MTALSHLKALVKAIDFDGWGLGRCSEDALESARAYIAAQDNTIESVILEVIDRLGWDRQALPKGAQEIVRNILVAEGVVSSAQSRATPGDIK